MNRKWTNRIRFVLDECIPPAIRDSRWFMYPFFWWAYRGRNIAEKMDFKKKYFEWDSRQLQQFYENIKSVSTDRPTDISPKCLEMILEHCAGMSSVLDVGCGKGYLLKRIKEKYPSLQLHGVDFARGFSDPGIAFTKADAVQLPFAGNTPLFTAAPLPLFAGWAIKQHWYFCAIAPTCCWSAEPSSTTMIS